MLEGDYAQRVRVWALTRLLPDGSPDPAFGRDGTVTGEPGDRFRVLSVAVQRDGKVLAGGFAICGRMCTASVLARFHPDGTPDAGFGDAGRVTLQLAETGPISALLVDADDRIIAGGMTRPSGTGEFDDFSVVRYLPDGTLDPTFGEDGRVRTDFRGSSDIVSSLALQADGAIVAGGTSHEPHQNGPIAPRFALARYLADGSPDVTFGGDGTVETDLSPEPEMFESLTSVALAPDGGVLAAGHARPDGVTPRIAVVRYTPAGAPEPAFGADGLVALDVAPASEASAVTVQDDGRVVVAGRAADNPAAPTRADPPGQLGSDTDWTWALLRLEPTGQLDETFGDGGVVRTAAGKAANEMLLEPDGQIVVAGCDCPLPQSGSGGVEPTSAMVVAR